MRLGFPLAEGNGDSRFADDHLGLNAFLILAPMMPELLVGYTPGYRNSSPSVLGATGSATIDLNPWAWSGDHSMARDLVPGSLFSSHKVAKGQPSILDLPVSILEFFDIEKPEQMVGSSIYRG